MMPKLIIFDNDGVLVDQDKKPIEGIQQVIECVDQQKISKCIASNGDTPYVMRALELSGLNKYFNKEDIVSLSLVQQGKPAPDLFLYAAMLFDVDPSECLVIEDHPMGVYAAHAAKMPVIGFLGAPHSKSRGHREELMLSNPLKIIEDSQGLLDFLIHHSKMIQI